MDDPREQLTPSAQQQSWGALISIIVIVLMIVVGAFYAWRERAAEIQAYREAAVPAVDTATTTVPVTP